MFAQHTEGLVFSLMNEAMPLGKKETYDSLHTVVLKVTYLFIRKEWIDW